MKYEPTLSEEEEQEIKTGWLSDNTAFMRMQTQLEKDDIVDKKFFAQYAPRIIQFNKFAALSNSDPRQKQIERIRTIKMDFLESAGLYEEAIKTGLDSIRDHQNLRGQSGFFQQALITQRHEIKEEKGKAEKMGKISGLFKKKEPEPQPEVQQ